ncbi:MAG TPA: sulfur carrier protein ThiS [Candidatus Aquilonibacter sp.]|nr:sulfur carrier protein ThiS [Candidatus Aquilonibacter sp.]
MKLRINGGERAFAEPTPAGPFTLSALVGVLGMKSDRVAIELNLEIAPRDRWPQIELKDGDCLEIVHFVGGGCCSLSGGVVLGIALLGGAALPSPR